MRNKSEIKLKYIQGYLDKADEVPVLISCRVFIVHLEVPYDARAWTNSFWKCHNDLVYFIWESGYTDRVFLLCNRVLIYVVNKGLLPLVTSST